MKRIPPFCAGIDIHKRTIVVCALCLDEQSHAQSETRTFATHTRDLQRARLWLQEHQVTHVAMESTGVFWKPVSDLLQGCFELVVVNPSTTKALIGRKTARADAHWIAHLLQQDLLSARFIPSPQQATHPKGA